MMWALLFYLLVSGGGGSLDVFGSPERRAVREVVHDEDRAAAIVDVMHTTERDLRRHAGELGRLAELWDEIDSDVETGRAELSEPIAEADEIRRAAIASFTDSLFEVRELTSPGEWAHIMGRRARRASVHPSEIRRPDRVVTAEAVAGPATNALLERTESAEK